MRQLFRHNRLLFLALLCLAWVLVALLNPLPSLKSRSTDVLLRERSSSGEVVLVKIDDKSMDKLGQWPWPRATFGALLSQLDSPSVVGLDLSFREPSRLGLFDDEALETTLASVKFPAVLPLHIDGTAVSYPLPSFTARTHQGFSNLPVDSDGTVRRMFASERGAPSFSYLIALLHGSEKEAVAGRPYRIHFHGRNTTYPSVSFIDVLENKVPDGLFSGRIVLVGVTASGLGTFLNTPFGLMSSLEVHANAVDTFRLGLFYSSSPIFDGLAVFLLAFASGLAALYARRGYHIAVLLIAALLSYWLIVIVLLERLILIDPFYPPLAALGAVFATVAYQFVVVREREETLRHAYDALNSMVVGMTDGVILVDKERRIVAHNPEALRTLGTKLGAPPRLTDIANALKEYVDAEKLIGETMRGGKIQTFRDVRIGERFFQLIIAPVSARASAPGVVFLFHDMTGEKELERVREDFTSMLVHELRSPLDVMRKMAEILRSPTDSLREERRGEYLTHINANASRMLDLVNDLLDVAKLEAGKFELHKEKADIRALIKDRIAFYTPLAEGVSLESNVEDAVPKELFLDLGRTVQVLNNLISNALKFTPQEGRVTLTVSMRAKNGLPEKNREGVPVHWFLRGPRTLPPEEAVIEVWNSGSEIAAEDIPRMFDKFKQFDAAARSKKKGTGLGLIIVRGITEGYGGVVGVASGRGGTSFLFTLPISSAAA